MEHNKPQLSLSYAAELPPALIANLQSLNPWWIGAPALPLPSFHRWPFARLQRLLHGGLTPATVLRGPRRIGKTILLRQLIDALLAAGTAPHHILYVPFDELPTLRKVPEPVLAIVRWYEATVLGDHLNAIARQGRPAFLFFDEVQNLDAWAPQIKNLVDNQAVRVLVTGSSSLRIEAGRDSLAGRITTIDLGPLLLREIAELQSGATLTPYWPDNGLGIVTTPDFWRGAVAHGQQQITAKQRAFQAFSERGAYPVAHERPDLPWPELADYLNETVIKRAIQHDLRMGTRGQKRDATLLEEVFRLCCRYAGQTPGQRLFVPQIADVLRANIGWQRILTYLRFLDGTLLLRLIPPLELRLKRQKSADKICLCDHALRASWLQEVVPLDPLGLTENPHLTTIAGHLAESSLGYFLAGIPNLDVAHFPERASEPEVDFVLTVGVQRIPVEVKYRRRVDADDLRGLRAFLDKSVYNAPFGLLVTLTDDVVVPDPRILPISLASLLWLR